MTTPNPQDPYGQPVDPTQGQQPDQGYAAPQGAPQGYPQQGYPQQGYAQPQYVAPAQGKNYVLALVLQFFLGSYGIADFYMGYVKTGVIKIVLGILASVLAFGGGLAGALSVQDGGDGVGGGMVAIIGGVLGFAMAVWWLVTFIMIAARKGMYATDSKGMRLV